MRDVVSIKTDDVSQYIPSIASIYLEAFPHYTRSLLGRATCENYFCSVMKHEAYRLLVATVESEVAGFAVVHIDTTRTLNRVWFFRNFVSVIKFSFLNPFFVLKRVKERFLSFYRFRTKKYGFSLDNWGAVEFYRAGYIDEIAVKSTFKRAGVGKRLIDACKLEAKKNNLEKVFLTVETDNVAAISFYRSEGFSDAKGNDRGAFRRLCIDLTV